MCHISDLPSKPSSMGHELMTRPAYIYVMLTFIMLKYFKKIFKHIYYLETQNGVGGLNPSLWKAWLSQYHGCWWLGDASRPWLQYQWTWFSLNTPVSESPQKQKNAYQCNFSIFPKHHTHMSMEKFFLSLGTKLGTWIKLQQFSINIWRLYLQVNCHFILASICPRVNHIKAYARSTAE